MNDPIHFDDLPVSELRGVFSANGNTLSAEQTLALEDFVRRLGGLENATLALAELERIERVA